MSWIDNFGEIEQKALHFQVLAPAQDLREFVAYYWILKCSETSPRAEEFLSPDGFEELIFSYGGAYQRRRCDSKIIERNKDSYIVGAKNTGLFCLRETNLKMVGVKLYPRALYGFFRVPLSDYFNATVGLEVFGNSELLQLESEIFDAKDKNDIVNVLNASLRRLVRLNLARFKSSSHQKICKSLNRLHRSDGSLSIKALTSDLNCHYRSLERLFKTWVGQAPKAYAQNLRFKKAFYSFCTKYKDSKEFYSNDFGYFDRSHFNRDFKFYTGSNPSDFISRDHLSTEVFTSSHRMSEDKDKYQ